MWFQIQHVVTSWGTEGHDSGVTRKSRDIVLYKGTEERWGRDGVLVVAVSRK